ncbi:MAG: NADH-quinone oxidoreductase subunit J [Chloroflexota bacterium]
MTTLQWVFLFAAALTLIAAIMVVASPRLVHAALWLVLTLAGVAVLFVLLEAGFLAAVQVVIYIGAIAILIIFAVMLTRRVMSDSGPQQNRSWWLALLSALLLFIGLLALIMQTPALAIAAPLPLGDAESVLEDLGQSLVDVDRYVLPFEVASVLLLAALIGSIVIARPPSRSEEGGES